MQRSIAWRQPQDREPKREPPPEISPRAAATAGGARGGGGAGPGREGGWCGARTPPGADAPGYGHAARSADSGGLPGQTLTDDSVRAVEDLEGGAGYFSILVFSRSPNSVPIEPVESA